MLGSPACFVFIFLLCQLTGSAASGTLKELVGALGGTVTFPLKHSVNQIDSIIWIFNTTPLVTIQPNTTDRQANVIVTQNRNRERVDFLHGNYSLTLSKLKKNDSGAYRVEIHSSSLQDPFIQEYGLHVYEHLSKPKVTMGLQNIKNGTCVTNLTCSVEEGGEDVTYSWKSLGQATNESHYGSILPISWRLGKKDMTFICEARNPISSNSSNPVSPQKLCEGALRDPRASIFLKLLVVVFLLSAVALVPVILIMRRERGKVSEFVEEKNRMDTHQETFNHNPPSGETSEYATTSHLNKTTPEENPANTLYFTVQIPPKMEKHHSLPRSPDSPNLSTYENAT
ncbi:SLAM family member 7 isoform X1 [Diceros bicornis minor]|uniref:SLAM family member 7 isoform X1 n=1 Tax=Diceros bicornis minor TaxID=77932 RepID=UPI0026F0B431|nr:SLAM family member 7 isoform X1 [Diceros bicornis minor]